MFLGCGRRQEAEGLGVSFDPCLKSYEDGECLFSCSTPNVTTAWSPPNEALQFPARCPRTMVIELNDMQAAQGDGKRCRIEHTRHGLLLSGTFMVLGWKLGNWVSSVRYMKAGFAVDSNCRSWRCRKVPM